ncbi:hypothetical protein SAMN04244579_02163 [Azotobacter beijerinckii]|uniref:Sialate O-acetylesterase domain-containing protein n=1 Tax=Azotobacter beijerinckii TaxID=170623 RepID=A0A1H6TVP4_9GAMM|nr:hypothetical protein [Azotobacter beijerinckii]SEI83286.1 hypothetical protein SAMN04244579_02163 [Azotobacter beijerinckii]
MTESLSSRVARFEHDLGIAHRIVHGTSDETVETENGPLRTFAKAMADYEAETDTLYANLLALITANGGTQAYLSRAQMEADLAQPDGKVVSVLDDPDPDNNGLYYKVGEAGSGLWAPVPDQPASERDLEVLHQAVAGEIAAADAAVLEIARGALAEADDQVLETVRAERAESNAAVLAAAKEHADATGVTRTGESPRQTSGDFYGVPVLSILDALGLSALLVNEQGEVGIPALLAGELVSSLERGPQYNYDFAIVDRDDNVLCGVLNGQWLQAGGSELANVRAELEAADAQVLGTLRNELAEADVAVLEAARRELAEGDAAVLAAAKAHADATGMTKTDEPLMQKAGDFYGVPVLSILGALGLSPLLVNDLGEVGIPALLAGELVSSLERGPQYNYDFAIVDRDDNVLCGVLNGQWLQSGQAAPADDPTAREMEAYAAAIPVGSLANDDYAPLIWDRNHVVGNGQSLMYGQEAWPALSKTPRYGNLMLGDAVRPLSATDTTFTPLGGAAFKPLVATNRDYSNGALLTDEQVAALAPGSNAAGETPLEALAAGLKRGLNDRLQTLNDARALVVSNVAVPGRTIEQLSKGASPHLYNRYLTCLSTAKGLADAEGKSYGVAVVALMQGEYNYDPVNGGTQNEEAYKALMLQWVDDHAADALAITGQAREPLFLTYQTTAAWTRDTDNLSIGMAQWLATKERANLYLVAPSYPVTDKGGHLDANGSRWMGWQFAKVATWSSVHRRRWRPLEPVQIRQVGKAIYVAYHVPHPPLRFADIYVGSAATTYAAKGFRVQDDTGYLSISGVEIVSPHVVKLSLTREPTGTAYVWYADKTVHNGGGNLADSDPTRSDDLYQYLPDSGMYAGANLAERVDRPYPLANFSIAYRLPVGFAE